MSHLPRGNFNANAPSTGAPGATWQAQQQQTRRRPELSFWLKSPTVQIIVVNTAIFIAVCISGHAFTPNTRTLLRWGANFGSMTLNGQWWRLLSSAFLHANIPHLALNMWAFLNLGILAELLFGRRIFVVLYVFCALGGSLASVWWHSDVVGVGASGAIFGVAGALLTALAFQHNRKMRAAMRGNLTSIALFVGYNIVFGAAAANVDNAAHLGGLITGLILGALLPSGVVPRAEPVEAPQPVYTDGFRKAPAWRLTGLTSAGALRYWLAFAVVAALLLAVAISARNRQREGGDLSLALKALRSGNKPAAVYQLLKLLDRRPNFPEAHFLLGRSTSSVMTWTGRCLSSSAPLNYIHGSPTRKASSAPYMRASGCCATPCLVARRRLHLNLRIRTGATTWGWCRWHCEITVQPSNPCRKQRMPGLVRRMRTMNWQWLSS